MSRIYDALKRSDEVEPNHLVQLIDAGSPAVAERDRSDLDILETQDPLEAQFEPHPVDACDFSGGYRSVPLRIPAGIPIFPFDGTDTRAAEQYRVLRTNLLQHPMKPQVVAVTSATPGDGKTITAINLAGILALKSDHRVLIIDADLRHASVSKAMGIDAKPGLGDVLRGSCTLEEAIVQIEPVPALHVLPDGRVPLNPAELLDSEMFRSVFARLRELFTYIVVDTTPMNVVADFKLVHQVCDGALVVLRPDHTKRSNFMKAIDGEMQFKILGTVINASHDWFLWNTQEYYEYYTEPSEKKTRWAFRRKALEGL